MNIDHVFYEDEIRCDYIIPSMIKRSWAAQIQILEDLNEACKEAQLKCYAEWGTLLGTIRHRGFIPWDDDMDVCMKRKDYDYLVNNYSSILPDNYSIVSFRSNPDFKQMLCRVVSSDHYRFDADYMRKYSGLPVALGIDIFPFDYLSGDEEYEAEREKRVRLVYEAVNELTYFDTPPEKLENRFRRIEAECSVRIDRKGDILLQLRLLLEKLFGEVEEADAKYVTLYPIWLDNHSYKFPVEYYSKSISMPFENTRINVPVCYDAVLKKKYGTRYMEQVRSGGAHDYPYIDNHLGVLRENFGFEWPTYRFNPGDFPGPDRKVYGTQDPSAQNRKCLFITYCASAFENMRSLAGKYIGDGYEVTILPVTKYDIAADMTGITPSSEIVSDEYYLKGLKGANICRDGGILDTHPDMIVTNFQYDEYNLITTVDKVFYSRNLRNHCNQLIYVPPFEAHSVRSDDERTRKLMPSYVCTPLTVVCDKIILHSPEMRERYIECLSSWTGDRYKSVWESKIEVLAISESDTDQEPLHSASCKRKVMFYVGMSLFAEHGEAAIDKIRKSFDTFYENSDRVDVVYVTQEGLMDNLKALYPTLYEKYTAYDFPQTEGTINIDDIDAYYGEASAYATEFINAKKPIMLMQIWW